MEPPLESSIVYLGIRGLLDALADYGGLHKQNKSVTERKILLEKFYISE